MGGRSKEARPFLRLVPCIAKFIPIQDCICPIIELRNAFFSPCHHKHLLEEPRLPQAFRLSKFQVSFTHPIFRNFRLKEYEETS